MFSIRLFEQMNHTANHLEYLDVWLPTTFFLANLCKHSRFWTHIFLFNIKVLDIIGEEDCKWLFWVLVRNVDIDLVLDAIIRGVFRSIYHYSYLLDKLKVLGIELIDAV